MFRLRRWTTSVRYGATSPRIEDYSRWMSTLEATSQALSSTRTMGDPVAPACQIQVVSLAMAYRRTVPHGVRCPFQRRPTPPSPLLIMPCSRTIMATRHGATAATSSPTADRPSVVVDDDVVASSIIAALTALEGRGTAVRSDMTHPAPGEALRVAAEAISRDAARGHPPSWSRHHVALGSWLCLETALRCRAAESEHEPRGSARTAAMRATADPSSAAVADKASPLLTVDDDSGEPTTPTSSAGGSVLPAAAMIATCAHVSHSSSIDRHSNAEEKGVTLEDVDRWMKVAALPALRAYRDLRKEQASRSVTLLLDELSSGRCKLLAATPSRSMYLPFVVLFARDVWHSATRVPEGDTTATEGLIDAATTLPVFPDAVVRFSISCLVEDVALLLATDVAGGGTTLTAAHDDGVSPVEAARGDVVDVRHDARHIFIDGLAALLRCPGLLHNRALFGNGDQPTVPFLAYALVALLRCHHSQPQRTLPADFAESYVLSNLQDVPSIATGASKRSPRLLSALERIQTLTVCLEWLKEMWNSAAVAEGVQRLRLCLPRGRDDNAESSASATAVAAHTDCHEGLRGSFLTGCSSFWLTVADVQVAIVAIATLSVSLEKLATKAAATKPDGWPSFLLMQCPEANDRALIIRVLASISDSCAKVVILAQVLYHGLAGLTSMRMGNDAQDEGHAGGLALLHHFVRNVGSIQRAFATFALSIVEQVMFTRPFRGLAMLSSMISTRRFMQVAGDQLVIDSVQAFVQRSEITLAMMLKVDASTILGTLASSNVGIPSDETTTLTPRWRNDDQLQHATVSPNTVRKAAAVLRAFLEHCYVSVLDHRRRGAHHPAASPNSSSASLPGGATAGTNSASDIDLVVIYVLESFAPPVLAAVSHRFRTFPRDLDTVRAAVSLLETVASFEGDRQLRQRSCPLTKKAFAEMQEHLLTWLGSPESISLLNRSQDERGGGGGGGREGDVSSDRGSLGSPASRNEREEIIHRIAAASRFTQRVPSPVLYALLTLPTRHATASSASQAAAAGGFSTPRQLLRFAYSAPLRDVKHAHAVVAETALLLHRLIALPPPTSSRSLAAAGKTNAPQPTTDIKSDESCLEATAEAARPAASFLGEHVSELELFLLIRIFVLSWDVMSERSNWPSLPTSTAEGLTAAAPERGVPSGIRTAGEDVATDLWKALAARLDAGVRKGADSEVAKKPGGSEFNDSTADTDASADSGAVASSGRHQCLVAVSVRFAVNLLELTASVATTATAMVSRFSPASVVTDRRRQAGQAGDANGPHLRIGETQLASPHASLRSFLTAVVRSVVVSHTSSVSMQREEEQNISSAQRKGNGSSAKRGRRKQYVPTRQLLFTDDDASFVTYDHRSTGNVAAKSSTDGTEARASSMARTYLEGDRRHILMMGHHNEVAVVEEVADDEEGVTRPAVGMAEAVFTESLRLRDMNALVQRAQRLQLLSLFDALRLASECAACFAVVLEHLLVQRSLASSDHTASSNSPHNNIVPDVAAAEAQFARLIVSQAAANPAAGGAHGSSGKHDIAAATRSVEAEEEYDHRLPPVIPQQPHLRMFIACLASLCRVNQYVVVAALQVPALFRCMDCHVMYHLVNLTLPGSRTLRSASPASVMTWSSRSTKPYQHSAPAELLSAIPRARIDALMAACAEQLRRKYESLKGQAAGGSTTRDVGVGEERDQSRWPLPSFHVLLTCLEQASARHPSSVTALVECAGHILASQPIRGVFAPGPAGNRRDTSRGVESGGVGLLEAFLNRTPTTSSPTVATRDNSLQEERESTQLVERNDMPLGDGVMTPTSLLPADDNDGGRREWSSVPQPASATTTMGKRRRGGQAFLYFDTALGRMDTVDWLRLSAFLCATTRTAAMTTQRREARLDVKSCTDRLLLSLHARESEMTGGRFFQLVGGSPQLTVQLATDLAHVMKAGRNGYAQGRADALVLAVGHILSDGPPALKALLFSALQSAIADVEPFSSERLAPGNRTESCPVTQVIDHTTSHSSGSKPPDDDQVDPVGRQRGHRRDRDDTRSPSAARIDDSDTVNNDDNVGRRHWVVQELQLLTVAASVTSVAVMPAMTARKTTIVEKIGDRCCALLDQL